jgi:hypothetical protein
MWAFEIQAAAAGGCCQSGAAGIFWRQGWLLSESAAVGWRGTGCYPIARLVRRSYGSVPPQILNYIHRGNRVAPAVTIR